MTVIIGITANYAMAADVEVVEDTVTDDDGNFHAWQLSGTDNTSTLEITHVCGNTGNPSQELDPILFVQSPSIFRQDDDSFTPCDQFSSSIVNFGLDEVEDGCWITQANGIGDGTGPYTLTLDLQGPGDITPLGTVSSFSFCTDGVPLCEAQVLACDVPFQEALTNCGVQSQHDWMNDPNPDDIALQVFAIDPFCEVTDWDGICEAEYLFFCNADSLEQFNTCVANTSCEEPGLETEKFYTETDKDIEAGFFGTVLPFKNAIVDTENPTQTVKAVLDKNGNIKSYNPGQYYAVTKVTALTDLQEVWITEDDNLCTDVEQPISTMNPNKVPGGAYVALMCPDGTSVDLSSELANSDPPRLFINDANNVEAHVENVPEGCMVFLGVKYSPGLKGENFQSVEQPWCENWEFVTAINAAGDEFRDSAHRVLEVVECGENEVINPANGKCICPEGFIETPTGICIAGET